MALMRYYDPFREIEEMQSRLNNIFEESIGQSNQPGLQTPVSDVYLDEKEENIVVEAHLAGYEEDDIDIDIENGALNIRAEHSEKESDKKKGRKYIVRESSSGFYRRIGLPKNVETENIKAHFEDGVLRVEVPMKDLPKPKKIAIEKPKGKKSKA